MFCPDLCEMCGLKPREECAEDPSIDIYVCCYLVVLVTYATKTGLCLADVRHWGWLVVSQPRGC